jgi:hypothetical protein
MVEERFYLLRPFKIGSGAYPASDARDSESSSRRGRDKVVATRSRQTTHLQPVLRLRKHTTYGAWLRTGWVNLTLFQTQAVWSSVSFQVRMGHPSPSGRSAGDGEVMLNQAHLGARLSAHTALCPAQEVQWAAPLLRHVPHRCHSLWRQGLWGEQVNKWACAQQGTMSSREEVRI